MGESDYGSRRDRHPEQEDGGFARPDEPITMERLLDSWDGDEQVTVEELLRRLKRSRG